MDHTEQQKIADRIKLLLNLTAANGCMSGEIEVAAYKIGSLVQKYGLTVSFPQTSKAQPNPSRCSAESDRHAPWFCYGEVIIIDETEKALFCRDENKHDFWIPRSQCHAGCGSWTRGDSGQLYVSRWWADKEGWTE